MFHEIDDLTNELRSEKVTVRKKAFSKLNDILNGRFLELKKTIDRDKDVNISWEGIFTATHQGILYQSQKLAKDNAKTNENDPMITNFSKVILQLCDSSANEAPGIPYPLIVSCSTEILQEEAHRSNFGKCYLQVLQKAVLKPKNNLTTVDVAAWKDLLKVLFNLLKSTRHNLPFLEIVFCTQQVIDLGCSFSQLAPGLREHLQRLEAILEKRTDAREKLELLIVGYHLCHNVAVDFRFEVCRFTESIAKHIHNVFKVDMNEKSKEILFKLMDLSIIVHYPALVDDKSKIKFVHDEAVWNSQLRNFAYIMNLEMKLPPKSKYKTTKIEINQVFIQLAARLCFLVYWDDLIWDEKETENPSSSKRVKRNEKLQALIEFAQSSNAEFNWKWLVVISEVIHNYSASLRDEDFQLLLQMLSQCQSTIDNEIAFCAFTKCCYILLQREESFAASTNPIIATFCKDIWHEIANGAARVCTSNNKNSTESHILLQVLIHFHKYPSTSFIEDVINIFLTKATIKSDATLQTLITLLTAFNLDSLPKGKEIASKILIYTFEKPTLADFKTVMKTSGKEKPSARILAKIGVICCLSKTDVVNFMKRKRLNEEYIFSKSENIEQQKQFELSKAYKRETDRIIHYIMLKHNERLLIEDLDFIKPHSSRAVDNGKSETPTEIKCILDSQLFEKLQLVIDFQTKTLDENNDLESIKDYLLQVLQNTEIIMNLVDSFLSFEAFNEEKFSGSFLVKKIDFHIQEIEHLFDLIIQKKNGLDLKDSNQLLSHLKPLLSQNYHDKICLKVRSFNIEKSLKWIADQVDHKFSIYDEDSEVMKIGWNEFSNAKMDEKMKFLAIETLCEYNHFEGVNTNQVMEMIAEIELDPVENMDLHTLFHIFKVFASQPPVSENVINWMLSHVFQICRYHHTHQYISGRLIESLADIVHLSKNYSDQTSNIIALFSSFGQLCVKPQYNSSVSIEYIKQFKTFHENFLQLFDEEAVVKIYGFMTGLFLDSEIFEIRMEAIKTLSFILHSDIETRAELRIARKFRNSQKIIFADILRDHSIQYNGDEMDTDSLINDETINETAGYLQMYSSLFCANFILRKPLTMEIAKLVLRFKLTNEIASKMFNKFLKFLKSDANSLMDSNSIERLLSDWFRNGYSMRLFPYYFTGSTSTEDFLTENYESTLLSVLKTTCANTEQICNLTEMDPKSSIQCLLPNCFSFLLPIQAGCPGLKFEAKALEMSKKLNEYFTSNEQLSALLVEVSLVIGFVLENVYDIKKFAEICGFEFDTHLDDQLIDCSGFNKCLQNLKEKFSDSNNQQLLKFFCSQKNYCHHIEKLLMMQKKKIQSTSLKEHKLLYLLQYCVLIEKLYDYLNDSTASSNQNIKGFIVREITNFLCYLISDPTYGMRLRETAGNILSSFLQVILPKCANHLKPFLNKIISSLVTVCKKAIESTMKDFKEKCFRIISFLVIDQEQVLEDEIANLDRFPDTAEFDELKQKQLSIKYKSGDFTLIQEIEQFLTNKKRKTEGLIALRENLAVKKDELKVLFEELTSTLGFSEDGESSLLHKLIRLLIGYSRHTNEDEDRAIEAIKCLGEIGNYDLSTMVFITEDHQINTIYQNTRTVQECQRLICHTALNHMEIMILHHVPRVFNSASKACYHMLELEVSNGFKESDYLRPYQTNTVSTKILFYEKPKKDKKLNFATMIKEEEYSTYTVWIKKLAGLMLMFAGDKHLELVTSVQKSFAEKMCPLMMQLLLRYDNKELNEEIIAGVNDFFESAAEKINYPKVNEGSIFLDKQTIRQMLNLAECIRMYCLDNPKSHMVLQADLNFLNIAKAAKHCEAFFTAVLYCEMWALKNQEISFIPYKTSISHKTLQEVLYEAYKAIGIDDALLLFVNPATQRSLYLQIGENNWQNLLEHDATRFESQDSSYINLLSNMGLHFLKNKLSSSIDQDSKSHQYECLWRMSKWDELVECDSETKDPKAVIDYRDEFEKFHYSGLKCLHKGDELGYKTAVLKARKSILKMLQQESLECTNNLYKFLGMSQLIQQIDDFAQVRFSRNPHDSREPLLKKWETQNQFPHDFKLIEPILTQRNSIYDTANIKTGKRTWIPEALQSNMLYIVKESIAEGCNTEAIKGIAQMKSLNNLSPSNKAEMFMKEAEIYSNFNMELAKHCLKRVLEEKEFDKLLLHKSAALRIYGEILAKNHSEQHIKIHTNYFKKSIKYLDTYAKHNNKVHLVPDVDRNEPSQPDPSQDIANDTSNDIDRKIKENICVFDIVAGYADREYISRSKYLVSTDFIDKVKTVERNKLKLKQYADILSDIRKSAQPRNKEVEKSYTILTRTIEIDETEIEAAKFDKKKAAGNAMFFYLRGAMSDSNHDVLNIFRIISIWLSNTDYVATRKALSVSLNKIPSYKFLVALPQLVVRLNDKNKDETNELLKKLIVRLAVEHPHHTLPLILALVNSYADAPVDATHQDEPRVTGAKRLWNSLKQNSQISEEMLKQFEEMSLALIDLANKDCYKMPLNHKLMVMKNLKHVQCPTLDLPIMKDCNYKGSVISIVNWTEKMVNVGGINAPKKIFCVCSDGVERPQLLKGKDDMRQDAVMQQVFGVVNQLLKENKDTQKHHARVRTYKVVPLSRRSGILEWCSNTIPVGTYLVGVSSKNPAKNVKGAHEKYYPEDWSSALSRQKLIDNDKADLATKEAVFEDICNHTHPAFHHFFYENYKEPGKHFERRLAYTTSVAVSSMVGYILGIGDRHCQNILIDYKTAEVIHIDFGVAFEQGKILPHKELIPFRLTRDMIAPMGVCGVEGVFRKTCEKTLEILRQNDKTLTTILEILLYDPMHSWTHSINKARRRQLDDDFGGELDILVAGEEERDSMASRALLRIEAKLRGEDDSSMGYLLVEGHVGYLIQKAVDPALLSRLFNGWQAHM